MMLEIHQVSNYFEEMVKDQRWHCTQTHIDIAYSILHYYRTCTQAEMYGLTQFGLPISGEQHIPGTKKATFQCFERGVIAYDPFNEADRVPGIAGPCYPARIDRALSGRSLHTAPVRATPVPSFPPQTALPQPQMPAAPPKSRLNVLVDPIKRFLEK